MTHDLIANLIEKTGYSLEKIEINNVEKETYYATLFLKKYLKPGDKILEVGAGTGAYSLYYADKDTDRRCVWSFI